MNKNKNWKKLSSSNVYENSYFTVRRDLVIKPNGDNGEYFVIDGTDGVFIVAMNEQKQVYLVELNRYPIGRLSLEVPAGGTDGEDPLVAAKRELKEETGLVAEEWKELGFVNPLSGVYNKRNHIFLATKLSQTGKDESDEEGITRLVKVPLVEVLGMVKSGQIKNSETITTLTMAALELGIIGSKS